MAYPTRAQIVADVTNPDLDVEVFTGGAWVSAKQYVTSCRARLEATGGDPSGIAMGPQIRPDGEVELWAAGWSLAGNRTPIRISFGFGASDKLRRFGGIVVGRRRGRTTGRWQLRGWDAHIEGCEVRSPMFRRRAIATRTTLTSVEDPTLSTYRGGLINYILWMCGGRPAEQAASYPDALFYYRCTTALIGPEHTWIPGDNPWQVILRLCRAAGGQVFQDGDGVITYVDPITLASGTPNFTFSDEILTQEQRAAQGKASYEDFEVEIDATAALTTVSCNFVGRLVDGGQQVYEQTVPLRLAPGQVKVVPCDTRLPLYSVSGVSIDAVITRSAVKATAAQVTASVALPSAQRALVTITNTLSEVVQIDAIRITGRPVSAGEEGSAQYSTGSGRAVKVEDSTYVQSMRHAAMLCRMLHDAGQTGGILHRLLGCGYDPDLFVGQIVGYTNADLGLSALRCRVVRIETEDGAWMDVALAPLAGLPTRDSVHIIGSISGTKDMAY